MQTVEQIPATAAAIARLVVPFVNSVRSVFQTMVKMETTVSRPQVKQDPGVTYDVSSIIGFSGDVVGTVVVSFQMSAAQKLVSAFAGAAIEPGTPDFADALGELANMIAGGAKKHLGASAGITVPTVILGKGHQVARLSDVPCLVIPCTTEAGEFAVEINIKQIAKA